MINVDEEQILKWDIEQLWNYCQILQEKPETNKETLEQIEEVKKGFQIKVPIYYFINEWFLTFPNTKRAKILGYGKFNIDTFMEEIEQRNRIMRKLIIDNLDDEESTEPR